MKCLAPRSAFGKKMKTPTQEIQWKVLPFKFRVWSCHWGRMSSGKYTKSRCVNRWRMNSQRDFRLFRVGAFGILIANAVCVTSEDYPFSYISPFGARLSGATALRNTRHKRHKSGSLLPCQLPLEGRLLLPVCGIRLCDDNTAVEKRSIIYLTYISQCKWPEQL